MNLANHPPPSGSFRHLPSLLVLGSVAVLATALAASPLGAREGQPRAVLPEPILDFGIVPHGDVVERKVTIENRGDAPLVFRQVRNSCACSVAEVPDQVPANGKAEVLVRLDTESLSGGVQSTVNLFTNDPANPRLDITVRVESRQYVSATPGQARYTVYQGFEGDGLIKTVVSGTSPKEFSILRVESPLPTLDVSFRQATAEERLAQHDGPQWVVESRLDPNTGVGPISGNIRVYTDHAKQKKLAIPVSGFVRPILHATPPAAEFDLGRDDEPFKWSHHVKNFATETIAIERVESDIEGLVTRVQPGENDHEFYLLCELPPPAAAGTIAGKLVVHTSSPKIPTMEIPVSLTVR